MKKCIEYRNKQRRLKSKEKIPFIKNMFHNQKRRNDKLGYGDIGYTSFELVEHLCNNQEFNRLYKNWKSHDYNILFTPSIDRLDDYKGYSFKNIRIVTWEDNNKRGWQDRKNGINNKNSKSILQLDLQGNIINKFYSIREASRQLGIHNELIGAVCRGKSDRVNQYKFKYVKG